ncbi:MAG TPA: insulinase family protein, partial [Cytophagaceae bacterium]
ESNISFMQMMGKSLLDVDEIESLTEIFDKIQKVTSKNLQDVANEVFDIDQFSFLTYIPE